MRRIGILLLVLLLCGCAAPQIAMEEQATPALTPAPVSESAPTPEPMPTPLPSLPPHAERVYLKDLDPPRRGIREYAFTGEALTQEDIEQFSAVIEEGRSWATLYECLEEAGASLEHMGYLTPEYVGNPKYSSQNKMYVSDISNINDAFAVIEVSGYIGGGLDGCCLYFTREGQSYRPYLAILEIYGWIIDYAEWAEDTWIIGEYSPEHGSGYDHETVFWYNLSDRSLKLNFTSRWLNLHTHELTGSAPEEIAGYVRFLPKLETETGLPVACEGGAFALDVRATILAESEYSDAEWESGEDWQDVLEKQFLYRIYYDPEAQDFFVTAGDAEAYYIRSEFLESEYAVRLVDFATIFREELTELAKDELSYRADWAKLLLGEMDEGEEGMG